MTMNENKELCQEWGGSMVEPVLMTAEEQTEFKAFLYRDVPDGYGADTCWMGATQDPTNADQFLFESDNSVLDPVGSCVSDKIRCLWSFQTSDKNFRYLLTRPRLQSRVLGVGSQGRKSWRRR